MMNIRIKEEIKREVDHIVKVVPPSLPQNTKYRGSNHGQILGGKMACPPVSKITETKQYPGQHKLNIIGSDHFGRKLPRYAQSRYRSALNRIWELPRFITLALTIPNIHRYLS